MTRFLTGSLQRRLSLLIGIAVGLAVLVTGVAAYGFTRWTVYDQLDRELLEVADLTRAPIQNDLDNLGGLSTETLRAANVVLMIVRSDGSSVRLDGETVVLKTTNDERVIAQTQLGSSTRSGTASDGKDYRIVAVPLEGKDARGQLKDDYALVIARPLAPTNAILAQLFGVLLGFGALMAILSAVVGSAVARSGIAPLRGLATAVARVTETDQLKAIPADGNDEIGELARAFNTMMYSLQSSRERQRRLIADAGHELRTPLTSLRTNIELLVADEKTGMLPEGARGDILRDVASQLSEFTSLVGDLVQLAKDEHVESRPEDLDLAEVVEAAIERAKRRGPGLTFDVQLEPFPMIGEPDLLERAVTNLLDNAVKFSPPEGTITVRLSADPTQPTLVVSDEGPGIAEADLPHIFDRFFRAETARHTPGTGLGLSIVAHTVETHGGVISAGRAPSGGAEFRISLPGRDAGLDPAELEAWQ